MELDFDKEMDAILRRARDGEAVSSATGVSHLDADEISAFAENALPEKAKMRTTAHLADCGRCRKILSNLVRLLPETESEIVHVAVAAPVAAIPWYRRFFRFPNLAYSLGALVLVFAGLIGFMTLRSLDGSQNMEVSQIGEKPLDTKSAPAASNTSVANNMANVTAGPPAETDSAAVSPDSDAAPHTATTNSNSSTVKSGEPPVAATETQPRDETLLAKTTTADRKDAEDDKPQAETKEEQNRRDEAPKNQSEDRSAQNDNVQQQNNAQRQNQALEMSPSTQGASNASKSRAVTDKAKKTDTDGETAATGGKTFKRSKGVWYDTAYDNQGTTNVTRGTAEYKKLDKNLRVIAENLGGTIVIVWKGKAYRIR